MLKRIILLLSILSVSIIIITSSFFSYVYNIRYYDQEYAKYNVYKTVDKESALNATNNLLDYFKFKDELGQGFFNKKEASHLKDVRNLIAKLNLFYLFSLVIFWAGLSIIYFASKKYFASYMASLLFFSGLFCIILFFALFFSLYFGFDAIFIRFHELLFSGNYAFDPAISNMKAMFPDGFFSDMILAIILTSALKSILLAIAGFFMRKRLLQKVKR